MNQPRSLQNVDVVCGMSVTPNSAAAESVYEGTTYYFCSQECKQQFDKDPAKFSKEAVTEQ